MKKVILIALMMIATMAQAQIVGTTQVGISLLQDDNKVLTAKQNLGVKFGLIEATGYVMFDKTYDSIPYDTLGKSISYGADLNIVSVAENGIALYFGGGYGKGEVHDDTNVRFTDIAMRCGAIQENGTIDFRYGVELKQRDYSHISVNDSMFGLFIGLDY